jgi:serine/threonine protein kinase
MSDTVASVLLARLGFLVVESLAEDKFRLVSDSPKWFIELFGSSASTSEEFRLTEIFPFVEVFLFDAQPFWEEGGNATLKSGAWIETDITGKDYNLEATALLVNDKKILLIELLGGDFNEKQSLLQKLRENNLNHDQIIKKIRAEIVTNKISGENTALIGGLLDNRYSIEMILGKGGLGIVYKANDIKTLQTVAIKMLLEDTEDIDYTQKLFEREIKILKRVNHPNVVGILDSGLTETGRPYFVMDYVEGKSLADLMEEERIWSVNRVLNLLEHICPALDAIHQEGIVHRDLKPANIMVKNFDGQEIGIILDLGIAKIVAGPKDKTLMKLTKTGVVVGTIQYLSPEQCLGKPLDNRTDIYALGIITYELLTGILPYESDTVQGWLFEHLQTKPPSIRSYNPMISPELDNVVLWALEKKRENRPQTTIEFLKRFVAAV